MSEHPPSAGELVGLPPLNLDEQAVVKLFLGKTRKEAQEFFHAQKVADGLTYMSDAGLRYYLPAALSYLKSDQARGNWTFAHGLLEALSSRVSMFGMEGAVREMAQEIAEYCDGNREKFGLLPEELMDDYLTAIREA